MSAERIARNDAIFREANDEIGKAAEAYDMTALIPFVCECADPGCRELVRMSLDEYVAMRRDPKLFVNAVGHERAGQGWAVPVAEAGGHVLVEKVGEAGRIAAELADADDAATAPVDGAAAKHER